MAVLTSAESRVAAAIDSLTVLNSNAKQRLETTKQATQLVVRLRTILDGSRTVKARGDELHHLASEMASMHQDVLDICSEEIIAIISQRYERQLESILPSSSSQPDTMKQPHLDRAEAILSKATFILAQYETILAALPTSARLSLSSINRQALFPYMPDFAHAVYRDLSHSRYESLTKDALVSLGLEEQWNFLVSRAAHRIMEEKVLGGLTSEQVQAERRTNGDEDLLEADHALNFAEEALPSLQAWLQYAVFDVLEAWGVANRQHIAQQTTFRLFETLGKVRARQLFDIISDFPASSPALQDLMTCGESVDVRAYISQQLGKALEARLLHPGASTRDIIQFYTHLIRSLRYVDPSGVILSHVIGPVRSYLRARSDTIPVIVAGLLGQAGQFTLLRDMMRESADPSGLHRNGTGGAAVAADTSMTLYDESANIAGANQDGGIHVDIAAMDESKRMVFIPDPDDDWAPRPVDAGPDYRQSRKSDVIAIIVSIFEDEEGFIAALERSCAEQIIKVRAYNTTKEYEMNENLKKRFGDATMSKCDVMLNDVKRSQRTDRRIHQIVKDEDLQQQRLDSHARQLLDALHPLILSRQFWPLIAKDDDMIPPPGVRTFASAGVAGIDQHGHAASSMMFTSSSAAAATQQQQQQQGVNSIAGVSGVMSDGQQLPTMYASALEAYQTVFPNVVHGRKMRWLPGRSLVHLSVEMDDGRTLDEYVDPVQAAVVQHVALNSASSDIGNATFTTTDLASHVGVSESAVREAISFWVQRGVLSEIVVDTYALTQTAS